MSNVNNINAVRKTALDRIDRTERHYKLTFFGAALMKSSSSPDFTARGFSPNRMHLSFDNDRCHLLDLALGW